MGQSLNYSLSTPGLTIGIGAGDNDPTLIDSSSCCSQFLLSKLPRPLSGDHDVHLSLSLGSCLVPRAPSRKSKSKAAANGKTKSKAATRR